MMKAAAVMLVVTVVAMVAMIFLGVLDIGESDVTPAILAALFDINAGCSQSRCRPLDSG